MFPTPDYPGQCHQQASRREFFIHELSTSTPHPERPLSNFFHSTLSPRHLTSMYYQPSQVVPVILATGAGGWQVQDQPGQLRKPLSQKVKAKGRSWQIKDIPIRHEAQGSVRAQYQCVYVQSLQRESSCVPLPCLLYTHISEQACPLCKYPRPAA